MTAILFLATTFGSTRQTVTCYYDEDDVGSWLHQTVTFETFALHCLWIHRKNVARSWREWLWWWFMIYHVWSYWWLSNDTAIKCRFYGWLLLRWRWWRHVPCRNLCSLLWPQESCLVTTTITCTNKKLNSRNQKNRDTVISGMASYNHRHMMVANISCQIKSKL